MGLTHILIFQFAIGRHSHLLISQLASNLFIGIGYQISPTPYILCYNLMCLRYFKTRIHFGLNFGFLSNMLELIRFGLTLQVSSATATFAMTFSASMSVVEYYLLKRFPVPYGRFSYQIWFML